MLTLRFDLAGRRYAIAARTVEAVLPLLRIEALPHAPAPVAGLISFRRRPVPVLDLAWMLTGRSCDERMSTRLVVVRLERGWLLALRIEALTEGLRMDAGGFIDTGIELPAAPWLGRVYQMPGDAGVIQLIEVERLLEARAAEYLGRMLGGDHAA